MSEGRKSRENTVQWGAGRKLSPAAELCGVWKLRRQEVRLERTRSPAFPGLLVTVESRLGAGGVTV